VLTCWGLVVFGIPAATDRVVEQLPVGLERSLGRETWKVMDSRFFQPSGLTPEQGQGVVNQFLRLQARLPEAGDFRLELRKSEAIGANAFAMPGGIVVVTDELVLLAQNPEELTAVLAHEFGHLHHRHSLHMALENSVLGMLVVAVTGDIHWIAGALPLLLLKSEYSRNFEHQADAYAARQLWDLGIPISRLADVLDRLQEAACKKHKSCDDSGWVSTHPPTHERGDWLRGLRGPPDEE
jgi:Zn-dependent protease with chaperone function